MRTNGFRATLILGLILVCSLGLRLYKLDHQSLWCDELHTMIEADPGVSWKQFFQMATDYENSPPLYLILARIMFLIFGATPFVARFFSAVAGTLGIVALYCLGKEIFNKELGILSALFGAVNYFSIYYSQEARSYTLVFLFTTLSFLFLIKSIKTLRGKAFVGYGVFTGLLLYTHYYSVFVLASQIVIIGVFYVLEKEQKSRYGKRFGLTLLGIIVSYVPWLPFLMEQTRIKKFWAATPSPDFITQYFKGFFGNAGLIMPFLFLFIVHYAYHVFADRNGPDREIKRNPLLMSFLVIFVWIVVTHLIPYLRSITVMPMLHPRFLIVALPGYLVALSYGAVLINGRVLRTLLVTTFIIFACIDLVYISAVYTTLTKTQFREVTRFVVDNNRDNFPVINEITAWQQQYYFKVYGAEPRLIVDKKETVVDSILAKVGTPDEWEGFWIVGMMGDQKLSPQKARLLETSYFLTDERDYYDAWAQLYLARKRAGRELTIIPYRGGFLNGTILPGDQSLALFGAGVDAKPVRLSAGGYRMHIYVRGQRAGGEDPRLVVYINGQQKKEVSVGPEFQNKILEIRMKMDADLRIKLLLANPYVDPATKEDRNLFIRHILLKRLGP